MPKGLPEKPVCTHKAKTFQCHELSMQDIRKIHQRYYQNPDLQWKRNFILQHVQVSSPKKKCVVSGLESRRKVSTNFILPKQRDGVTENVRVCRVAFLGILQEKRDRVNRLCQKLLEFGTTPSETRGGDRRSLKYEQKRESVKAFIKRFRPVQSHYCRGKNTKRQYLVSELNTKRMWTLYVDKHPGHLHVEYEYFRKVFTESFNISFDSPYSDRCSTCSCLENKISNEKEA